MTLKKSIIAFDGPKYSFAVAQTLLAQRWRYIQPMRSGATVFLLALLVPAGCQSQQPATDPSGQESADSHRFEPQRDTMVRQQIAARGIQDERVLAAMRSVPRHRFVPEPLKNRAHRDGPLPIGHGQTISQPYIVALMTELVNPQPDDRALDVGTGSGYQAAILAELVDKVYSIEIVPELGNEARERLQTLGIDNVRVRVGDGYQGWPEKAPFDVIILAAAPPKVPEPLVSQLAEGGRMALPVGSAGRQELLLIEKDQAGEVTRRQLSAVAFVPMTGQAQADADR